MLIQILGIVTFVTGLFLWPKPVQAAPKTICSVTFNSIDERETLRRIYEPQGARIIELVPTKNDGQWFEKACQSGIQCDVLLFSGHFGGIWFGEQLTSTIDMNQLAKASCSRSCPGILESPKQVYLMGCNTLASKTPDHRSIEQYLQVLVNDGFPRDLAEKVAASRYGQYGFAISQEMASIFYNAEVLYGFGSTGPLGAQNAPLLSRAHRNKNITEGMKAAYAGTSFRVVRPQEILNSTDRYLMCASHSPDTSNKTTALRQILRSGNIKNYIDLLLNNSTDPALQAARADVPPVQQELSKVIDQIWGTSEVLTETRFNIMNMMVSLGILSPQQKYSTLELLIRSRLAQGLNYISADQLCAIGKKENITFKYQWMEGLKIADIYFLPRVIQCFQNRERSVDDYLKQLAYSGTTDANRRETFRALTGKWSENEKLQLQRTASTWNRSTVDEAFRSAGLNSTAIGSLPVCFTEAAQLTTTGARDHRRWTCFEQHKNSLQDSRQCFAWSSLFENRDTATAAHWHCLTRFPSEVNISSCQTAAAKNPDITNGDDMLWYCWDQMRALRQIDSAECLGLAQSFQIYGNRIKQNWNCVNRLPK